VILLAPSLLSTWTVVSIPSAQVLVSTLEKSANAPAPSD
jgi:hypothetical protein